MGCRRRGSLTERQTYHGGTETRKHGNVITVPPLPTQFPEHEAVAVYGNKTEFEEWKAKDPVALFRSRMMNEGVINDAAAQHIEDEARKEVEDAVQFALASPLPAAEEAVKFVYA